MIRGLTQDVEIQGRSSEVISRNVPEYPVIGVICAGDLAIHRDSIKQALQRGIEQRPEAVWVCIEPKSDRMTHDVMISLGLEPVVLPMLDAWRLRPTEGERERSDEHQSAKAPEKDTAPLPTPYDFRRVWRDLEMLSLCDELIVFHKASGDSPWRAREKSGLYANKLVIVDLGKEKKA